MQIHQLRATNIHKKSKRIGRGGKRGTFSGRGIKGQRARAGARIRPVERDFVKKIPKLRGYRFKSFRPQPTVVNLDTIERLFENGATITPKILCERG